MYNFFARLKLYLLPQQKLAAAFKNEKQIEDLKVLEEKKKIAWPEINRIGHVVPISFLNILLNCSSNSKILSDGGLNTFFLALFSNN